MDPISVLILAAIYAALRGNREARRAVGRDYRGRRDRWASRAEPWMSPRGRGRGRGGRRVAGYDRTGRAFTRDQAAGRRSGDPGWRTDPRAWRGPEGRARVARGIRPSAIRAGIITGAMAYTAVFGASVAARGFATGARGGYQLGKAHYRAKRNNEQDPTFTVTPGQPGDHDPNTEIVDAVIVEDANTTYEGSDDAGAFSPRRERPKPGYVTVVEPEPGAAPVGRWVVTTVKQAYNKEIYRIIVEDADIEEVMARRVPDGMYRTIRPLPANDPGRGAAGWKISRYTSLDAWMLNEEPAEYITVTDPLEFDRHLDQLMRTGQIFDVRGMADYEVERERERARSRQDPAPREAPSATDAQPAADPKNGPWLLTVHGPGVNRFDGSDSEGIAVYDAADLDRRLALVAEIPGLSAEVKPLPNPFEDSRPQNAAGSATTPGGANVTDNSDQYEWQCPECGEPVEENSPTTWTPAWGQAPSYSHLDGEPLCPVVGATGYEPAQPEPRDPQPESAGPSDNNTPGDDSLSELATTRPTTPSPAGITGQYVPVGPASISAPVLMEGANFDAHLHNLDVIAKEARSEYSSAELTLASASAARQRAEHAMNAVEQMAVGLAAQDFGETHVGNMASLHELLARHVGQAQAAERAAQESLATSEQLIEMCTAAANVFRRDHGQLAEAHANAPHAARTREAYQPM